MQHQDWQCDIDGVEMQGQKRILPLLVSAGDQPLDEDKARLALAALILRKITGQEITKGLVHTAGKTRFIALARHIQLVEKAIREISLLRGQDKEKHFFLNKHCGVCLYTSHCRKKAVESDHLSLLQNLPLREIRKQNDRGIFTVLQLSHTFRPRRERPGGAIKNNPALRALAIREKKAYVVHRPKVPAGKASLSGIFLPGRRNGRP